MLKSSAPKRTGIYRICGNPSDFKLQLKLRHLCEWLPVPKFEYSGANRRSISYYPESSRESGFDFCIYVPYEDRSGNNYYSYYNYDNSGNSSARSRSISNISVAAQSQSQSLEPPVLDAFQSWNRELCNGATASLYIGWQQKHFSRVELQRYADASKCHTTLQRRYHRWTQQILKLQQQHQQHMQRKQMEGNQKQQLRQRGRKSKHSNDSADTVERSTPPADEHNFVARTCLIYTVVNADLLLMEDSQLPDGARQLLDDGFQLMYVYAQLQQETLLLYIGHQPANGLLHVYPDFCCSANDMDYVLEIDNDCRQLYAYGFENLTPLKKVVELAAPCKPLHAAEQPEMTLPPADATSQQMLDHFRQQRFRSLQLRRLLQFVAPPKRMRRVTLLMELREAQHFEYANIHVRYYMHLPPHTLLEPANGSEPFAMHGTTASCVAVGGATKVAHLSHCWQLTLLCDEELLQLHQHLHIYFEVISVDSWQRERCEGYAHFSCSLLGPLPPEAIRGLRLQCSRPLGNWWDALNRYFIGGRVLFDFIKYFDTRLLHGKLLHNRWEDEPAKAMTTTGTLLFAVRKVQQRYHQLGYYLDTDESDDDDVDDGNGNNVNRKSRTGMSKTLNEVIAAYVEVRDRIEAMLAN
ncbi:Meckel syndrome type 1 protein homolog [Drosophila grimshawi]|uniref:GH24835 n=1 Tax=Drosophila grimshawi TaxID=7222 RepID=B4JNK1_DROGR|nr:Meckel syndrome type 1 protein homolog [Drosophila grimshawi]EDV92294.1 GH24835 [Drosophila grimshawi]